MVLSFTADTQLIVDTTTATVKHNRISGMNVMILVFQSRQRESHLIKRLIYFFIKKESDPNSSKVLRKNPK